MRVGTVDVIQQVRHAVSCRSPSWHVLILLLALQLLSDCAAGLLSLKEALGPNLAGQLPLAWTVVQGLIFAAGVLFWWLRRTVALRRVLALALALYTFGLGLNVAGLIFALTRTHPGALILLRDGVVVWWVNVLLFAAWYWLLDSREASPQKAPEDGGTERRALMFPQESGNFPGWAGWHPGAIDYVFLAFVTSMAFSPTDTYFLSGRAKMLMMAQAGASLLIVALIVARAVNIIP